MRYEQQPQIDQESASPEVESPSSEGSGLGSLLLRQAIGGNNAMLDLLGLRSAEEKAGMAGMVEGGRVGATCLLDGVAAGVKGATGRARKAAWELNPAFGLFGDLLGEQTDFAVDMTAGFAKGGVDTVAGLGALWADPLGAAAGLSSLAAAAPTPLNPFKVGRELLQASAGEGSVGDALLSGLNPAVTWEEDKGILGAGLKSVIEPYQRSLEAGKPGEVPGRLLAEFGPDLLELGWAAFAGKANKAADLGKVAEAAKRLDLGPFDNLASGAFKCMEDSHGPRNSPGDLSELSHLPEQEAFDAPIRRRRPSGVSEEDWERQIQSIYGYVERADPKNGKAAGLYLSRRTPPELRAEVLYHELNHLYASPKLTGRDGLAFNEGFTSVLTGRQLGIVPSTYPNTCLEMRRIIDLVGMEFAMETFHSGDLGRLAINVIEASGGEGPSIRTTLMEAFQRDSLR